jgi:hypothetical protein
MNKIEIVCQLWDSLWQDYRARVNYACVYQNMIQEAGGTIANDHIAFRSLRLNIDSPKGKINLGIPYLATIVEALGYQLAGEYNFPDQYLYARHYRHPQQQSFDLPKLFISELIVEELPTKITQQIQQTVTSGKFFDLSSLQQKLNKISTTIERESLVTELKSIFTRPWQPPKKSIVEAVNSLSQYGAWVLLHGYNVNHFTGYINRQNTPQYPNIETTAEALATRNIPMKAEIEGSWGNGLRQTATQAVTEMVTVQDDISSKLIQIPWTYAYYELAERNEIENASGERKLFEGFLSSQAKNLFEMTKTMPNC